MKRFKISELECFSGIKAHTIRIWEQRYNLFNPGRTDGNIRYYSLNEVRLLIDIALLLQYGHKISRLAKMDAAAIAAMVDELSSEEAIPAKTINDLIILMYNVEIEEFEDVLDGCVHVLGIEATIKGVIIPFLGRVQLLSYSNTGNHIHLAVTAIRKKIIAGIESADPAAMTQKSALLFLPEREHYDLILLYTAYILKCAGVRVLYLGTNISIPNLELMTASKKPEFLFTFVPQKQKFTLKLLPQYLKEQHPGVELHVLVCEKEVPVSSPNNLHFHNYLDLERVSLDAPVMAG